MSVQNKIIGDSYIIVIIIIDITNFHQFKNVKFLIINECNILMNTLISIIITDIISVLDMIIYNIIYNYIYNYIYIYK